MIAGMSGSLLSHDAVERLVTNRQEQELLPEKWLPLQKQLRTWHAGLRRRLGPAAGPRSVFDLVGSPLASTLGFTVVPVPGGVSASARETLDAELRWQGAPIAVMVVSAWGRPGRSLWRHAVHRGLAHHVRWAIGVTGPSLCLFDAERAYSRRFVEFDLAAAFDSDRGLAVLCGLAGAGGLAASPEGTAVERAIVHSERYRSMVRRSLRRGVHDAVLDLAAAFRVASKERARSGQLLDESLIVVYRLLFLLFAEARGLVPIWHPVYRDGYSIGGIRRDMELGTQRGLWETLQAIARLAHRGCTAGTLKVPPFNGRLFSPSHAPLAARARLDDRPVAAAIRSLTTRTDHGRQEEIAYADLGVEQLGGIYEHLLDFDLDERDDRARMVPTGRRKATGSFYTPRPLTEFLVRRSLAPLVEEKRAEEILALRVLDPAMGSGAFLVAACRYLAAGYEAAVIRDDGLSAGDISEADRADFRRAVVQRCLYGVDLNPMAVQLARLSLWLATLAADKPLTFLDHRLRVGHSLIGASIDDLAREPAAGRVRRPGALPLFSGDDLHLTLRSAVGVRRGLADVPDDSLEQVRSKERTLASLEAPGGALEKWRSAADLWCAAYLDQRVGRKGIFGALRDLVLTGTGPLPSHVAGPLVAQGRLAAAEERVFHWMLEFPEVFYDERGEPDPAGGFDVVLGNPPWEMVRGAGGTRAGLIGFVRGSGQYRLQGDGHANLYQLFFERGLRLLRPGGRCGLILPAGFAGDHGCGRLRRHLFDHGCVETFTTVDNRDGLFPIHRGLKFLLLIFRTPGRTATIPSRSGVRSAEALEQVADTGADPEAIDVPRALVERVSGESLAIPDVRSATDLHVVTAISLRVPALAEPEGWNVHFGRELNATDDRPHFGKPGRGLPVVEGKQLSPFRVALDAARHAIAPAVAARLLDPGRTFGRARLGYREVAAAANRLTLIAAIVPARAVTTHTVFCLRDPLDDEAQLFLCGAMNSYVANYLVRMRVGTHVTTAIVSRLPVPKPPRSDHRFGQVVQCARALTRMEDGDRLAELNAVMAGLYGLEPSEFAHILGTFPLVPASERAAALHWYHSLSVGHAGVK